MATKLWGRRERRIFEIDALHLLSHRRQRPMLSLMVGFIKRE